MCFVAVEGEDETYKHVHKKFMYTANVDQHTIEKVAKLLGIPDQHIASWKPGKLTVVSDSGSKSKK